MVLSLIFLKFISDKFEAQRKSLVEQGMGDYVEQIEFYAKDNVFYSGVIRVGDYLHIKEDS